MSGIALTQYAVNTDADAPDEASVLWLEYENPIELHDRAVYYVHARTVDAAGNVTIETFGPFVIKNNPPVFNSAPTDDVVVQDNIYAAEAVVSDLDDLAEDLMVSITSGDESIVPAAGVSAVRDADDAGLWHIQVIPAAGVFTKTGVDITLTVTDPFGASSKHTFTLVIQRINTPPLPQICWAVSPMGRHMRV